ncbi:hypothetical protein PIB30_064746 [Stylosanthes scabra]|uniref:Uncharacterized protein n=1 Tax=Stylosanthes scabra TaxID=79078 RepID=A0ABU6TLJ2_9FABA|nr:hypothetical protein [Stylosanthes scabra]
MFIGCSNLLKTFSPSGLVGENFAYGISVKILFVTSLQLYNRFNQAAEILGCCVNGGCQVGLLSQYLYHSTVHESILTIICIISKAFFRQPIRYFVPLSVHAGEADLSFILLISNILITKGLGCCSFLSPFLTTSITDFQFVSMTNLLKPSSLS